MSRVKGALIKAITCSALSAAACGVRAQALREPRAPDRAPPARLELLVLGSGGPAALGRAASGYLVLVDGEARVLIDAGPGTFARVGEARTSLEHLDTVLLTHLHVDHAAELPGIVKARAVTAGEPIRFQIYGPTGRAARGAAAAFPSTREFVQLLFGRHGAFAYLQDFSAPVSFQVTDLPGGGAAAGAERTLRGSAGLTIRAAGGHHGDAPSVIYRVDCGAQSIVFSGDIDAAGLPALERLARGARLLVFDAVVLDPPGSPKVLYTLHSPPAAIGALAARAAVGELLLSHLSPAVDAHHDEVTASIAAHYHGSVRFASDLMRVQPR